MNILSLNSNGFGKGVFKVRWFANLISRFKIAIAGIQETKRKDISEMAVKRIWGSSDFDYAFVNMEQEFVCQR